MLEMLETHRRIYNNALAQRRDVYEAEGKSISYGEQSANYKVERIENEYYQRTNFSSCQATLRRLDKSFKAFFHRIKSGDTPGYPRFRGRGRFSSVEFPSYGDGCKMRESGRAYFQHIGEVKVKLHRPFEGKIKTMRFKNEAGKWYLVLACDLGDCLPSKKPIESSVGIDLGLKTFAVLSDGSQIDSKRYFRDGAKKLRRLQRTVSRRKKGSNRWRKACRNVARFHAKVANQRRDWHFKEAHKLVNSYDLIALENLNIKGIARTRLAKSTLDAGWAQFTDILSYKAECAGTTVVKVNPAGTTQTCSSCGSKPDQRITLQVRTYKCSSCGLIIDRDLNAAHNILKLGRSFQESIERVAA